MAFMCVEGEVTIRTMGHEVKLPALETVLIPADATDVVVSGKGKLLESFVK